MSGRQLGVSRIGVYRMENLEVFRYNTNIYLSKYEHKVRLQI